MKIRLHIIIITLLLCRCVYAQQSPQFSHYVFNYYAENPAYASTQKCLDFKIGGRYQWLGFDGAPQTYFASIIVPLTKQSSYHKTKHFVGLYVAQDRMALISQTYIKASYSIQTRLFRDVYGAFGIFAGIKQYAIDNALSDPAIQGGAALHYPDIMPGILFYNRKHYLGFSVEQVYPNTIKNFTDSKFENEYYFSFGKRKKLNSKTNFYYSANFKFSLLTPPDVDLDIYWEHRKLTFGAGYRIGEAAIALIKWRISDNFILAYAFDFPLNKLRTSYANTHELILDFSKCGNENLPAFGSCPAYQ